MPRMSPAAAFDARHVSRKPNAPAPATTGV
jgi:hypothetical protein